MEISIIIPIYNSEKYIEQCIQSILAQSFKDFELILIDDGSTDNSYNIVKQYADSDTRLILIKKENGGVSSARNCGLEIASGKYVTFIDSDDYVLPDFLEKIYSKTDGIAELVFSGLVNMNGNTILKKVVQKDCSWDLNKEDDFINFLYQPLQSSPCAKLYSHDIIKKNHLRFDTALFCAEDRDFNLKFFEHIQKANSLSYSGYCYRREVINSLTKRTNPNAFKNRCIHWKVRHEMCQKRHFENERTQIILAKDLYFNANNEVMKISKEEPFKNAIKKCKEKMAHVDFTFLRKWKKHIPAPKWQSFFLLHGGYFILIILNKIYLYGQKKG